MRRADLARHLQVHRSTVTRIANGERGPGFRTGVVLLRISEEMLLPTGNK